jgi:HEAT repeat protein
MPLFGPPDVKKLEAKKNVKGLIKALDYDRDVKVRVAAARALGRSKDPRAVDPLLTALKDLVGEFREAAVQALDTLKWTPDKSEGGIAYWIQKGTNEKSQPIRQSAINALVQIGEPAVGPLIAELKSDNWASSSNAATALGLIGDHRAVEPLIGAIALHSKTKSVVHGAIVKALGQIGDQRAVEPLISVLRDEANKAVHEEAIKALSKIGSQALEPLIALLKDGNATVRAHAVKALGQTGDPRILEPLIAATKDSDWFPRGRAIEALGMLFDSRAVEPIITALKDEHMSIRMNAAQVLGRIGDSRAVEPLITALEDTEQIVRKYSAVALDLLGWKPDQSNAGAWYWIAKGDYKECVAIGAAAVEPLITVLSDKDANVCNLSAEALVQIGDAAVEPLIAVLKDEDRNVRERAATSLLTIYKIHGFDEQVKRAILTQANMIKSWERPRHHDHSDRSWGGCFGDANHSDTDSVDPGFHADFS